MLAAFSRHLRSGLAACFVVIGVAMVVPGAAQADRPSNGGGGGGVVDPCTGRLVTWEYQSETKYVGNVTLMQEWGTATDQVTGDTYQFIATFRVTGTPFVDPVWSSIGTYVLVGHLTIHDFTLTNENPDPPLVIPNEWHWTCAGSGSGYGL